MFLKGFPKLTFFYLFELGGDIECFSTGSCRFEAITYIHWIKFGKICHDFTVIYIGHSEGRWYAIHHQLNWQNLKRKARWSIFLRRKLPENGLWKWAQISCCLSRVGLSLELKLSEQKSNICFKSLGVEFSNNPGLIMIRSIQF